MKPIHFLLSVSLLFPQFAPAQTDYYQARREKVSQLTENGLIIVANKGGNDYTGAREHQDFYYLTGVTSPNAVLVINGRTGESTLYRSAARSRQPVTEPAGLVVKTMEQLNSELPRLLSTFTTLWMDPSQLDVLQNAGNSLSRMEAIRNVLPLIHGMRAVKDDLEIEILSKAAEITANGLVEMMKSAKPGMNEKELELMLDFMFKLQGSNGLGFGIQAASGPNSTSVHYGRNDRITQSGDMMVFDVGAKYENYTADISRSFPISGKFTKEQREIYEIVLKTQKNAISKMKPGADFSLINRQVTEDLNQGLAALGLITDTTKSWQKGFWIQHGWSHHIGLLVHDVSGPYKRDEANTLQPGMIYTMEPGLYFPENYLDADSYRRRSVPEEEWDAFVKRVGPLFKKYVNIGVRIEDDVLITPQGNSVITTGVPKEIGDIEKLMIEKGRF